MSEVSEKEPDLCSLGKEFNVSMADRLKWRSMARHIVIEQAQIYGVEPSDIMSHCRIAGISKARHAVMWHIKKSMPGISDRQIGNLLDRDRTTVIHGIQAHEKRLGKQK